MEFSEVGKKYYTLSNAKITFNESPVNMNLAHYYNYYIEFQWCKSDPTIMLT